MELAFKVTVPPVQIAPALEMPVDDGVGLTVAIVVAASLHHIWSVGVKVYVPVAVVGTAVIEGLCNVLL